ncbi:MAG: hypothetical protein HRT35_36485, partial [Algicola sp.]|nr:hypothetical protein [Algicola sp.]
RMVGCIPNDFVSAANLLMPDNIRSRRNLERLAHSMPEYYQYYQRSGLFPSLEEFQAAPAILINDGIVEAVAKGKIDTTEQTIAHFAGRDCHFTDGTKIADLDHLILCTGYRYNSNFDYVQGIDVQDEFAMGLFYGKNPSLVNPYGLNDISIIGSLPYLEHTARWYAQLISGKYQLNSEELKHRANPKEIVVAPVAGILMGLKLGFLPQPQLQFKAFWQVMTLPAFPMFFRLHGPHAKPSLQARLDKCIQRALIHSEDQDEQLQIIKYRLLAGMSDTVLTDLRTRDEITPAEYDNAKNYRHDPLQLDWQSQFMTMQTKSNKTGEKDQEKDQKQFLQGLKSMIGDTLGLPTEQISFAANLSEYGFNSVTLAAFAQQVAKAYDIRLSPLVFMENFTLETLGSHIYQKYIAAQNKPTPAVTDEPAEQVKSVTASDKNNDIAIVGYSGRFPQAQSIDQFWQNLVDDKSTISEIPPQRWSWQAHFGQPDEVNKTDCRYGGFIEHCDQFDPLHFNISPKEATLMDPQHRLLLEATWETIEHAGYSKDALFGRPVGLFVGVERQDYAEQLSRSGQAVDIHLNVGNSNAMLVNRIAHYFAFNGPVMAVNAACASSFVALHSAIKSLRDNEVEMALAGGVNLLFSPDVFICNRKLQLFTADDKIRAFDRDASGHFFSDGLGLICLKRMVDAQRDGDHIHGIIKGMAVRHGGQSMSLLSPNAKSHRDIIREALNKAQLQSKDIDYIEAQGTANPMADLVELQAYQQLFGDKTGKPLIIGTIKGHTGHFAGASGVISVIKGLMCLKHNTLIKVANLKQLNWDESDGDFNCEVLQQN